MFFPTAKISMKIHCNMHLDKPVCVWCCKSEFSWNGWNDSTCTKTMPGASFSDRFEVLSCAFCAFLKVIVIHSTKQQFAALLMDTFFCLIHHCALQKAGVLYTQQNGNSFFFFKFQTHFSSLRWTMTVLLCLVTCMNSVM